MVMMVVVMMLLVVMVLMLVVMMLVVMLIAPKMLRCRLQGQLTIGGDVVAKIEKLFPN